MVNNAKETIALQGENDIRKKKKKVFSVVDGAKYGNAWFALLLLIPALFNFIVFWCIPNATSFIYAFTDDWGAFSLGNFKWVFQEFTASDGVMKEALGNTLIYFCVGYFITQTFNVILAYFFYKKIKGARFFRAILYFPNILVGSLLTTVYVELLSPLGPLMPFLKQIGLIDKIPQLLTTTGTAMPASIGYSLWVSVGSVLLWCTGAMARIPKELLEASQLDGITPFKEFVHIILPLISGTLSTLYIIGISGILGAGGATLYLTNGKYGTMTLSFWLFTQIRDQGSVGTSAALGLLMTAVSTPLVFIVKWIANKLIPEVSF